MFGPGTMLPYHLFIAFYKFYPWKKKTSTNIRASAPNIGSPSFFPDRLAVNEERIEKVEGSRSSGRSGEKNGTDPMFSRTLAHSPSLNSDKITDSKDVKKWVDSYLGVGEWVMDQSVAVLGSTSYFERRR